MSPGKKPLPQIKALGNRAFRDHKHQPQTVRVVVVDDAVARAVVGTFQPKENWFVRFRVGCPHKNLAVGSAWDLEASPTCMGIAADALNTASTLVLILTTRFHPCGFVPFLPRHGKPADRLKFETKLLVLDCRSRAHEPTIFPADTQHAARLH